MPNKRKTRAVQHFMTSSIICAKKNDSVRDLCGVMAKENISCMVIKGHGGPAGIITERDIIKKIVASNVDPAKTKASDIMSKPIIGIDRDRDLTEALDIMRSKKVRRIVVTTKKNKIKGLITQTDVINALYETLISKLKEIEDVYIRTQQLFKDSVKALLKTLDAKDHYTGTHSRAVAKLSFAISDRMGLDKETKRVIHLAGLFHDIGKIHLSDKVLNKKGPLLKEEYEQVKLHPIISEMILRPITEFSNVLDIIRHHHEWYNGKGYPDGIKGRNIPLGSRIICVADSYNAMRTKRPYRDPMDRKTASDNIKNMAGKQFDPKVAKAFLEVLKRNKSF